VKNYFESNSFDFPLKITVKQKKLKNSYFEYDYETLN